MPATSFLLASTCLFELRICSQCGLQDPRGLVLPKGQDVLARRLVAANRAHVRPVWAALRRCSMFALALQWQRLGPLSAALRWWLELSLALSSWRLWLWFVCVLAFLQ